MVGSGNTVDDTAALSGFRTKMSDKVRNSRPRSLCVCSEPSTATSCGLTAFPWLFTAFDCLSLSFQFDHPGWLDLSTDLPLTYRCRFAKVVCGKIRAQLGGRVRYIGTGRANCLCLVSTGFVFKTAPLPCLSAAFAAKTAPSPCVSAAFAVTTVPCGCRRGGQGGRGGHQVLLGGGAKEPFDSPLFPRHCARHLDSRRLIGRTWVCS